VSLKKDMSRRNVAAMARQNAEKAVATLVRCMDSPDERVALDAASRVLDRAVGKPIAMTADVTDRLDEFTDDELDAAIADLKRRVGAVGTAGSEESAPARSH
jgi:hypothetical protein